MKIAGPGILAKILLMPIFMCLHSKGLFTKPEGNYLSIISLSSGLLQQIPGAVYWPAAGLYNITGGCAATANQPTVSFQLGTKFYAIPPNLWVIKVCVRA